MHYEGHYNTRCTLCNAHIGAGWHPMVVRVSREPARERSRRICNKCFQTFAVEHSRMKQDSDLLVFESWIESRLSGTVFAAPASYTVKGFWFGLFDDGPLGLIVNYEEE